MTFGPPFVVAVCRSAHIAQKFEIATTWLSNGILKAASIHDKGKLHLQLVELSLNQQFIPVQSRKIGKPEFDSRQDESTRLAVHPSQTRNNRESTRDSCYYA